MRCAISTHVLERSAPRALVSCARHPTCRLGRFKGFLKLHLCALTEEQQSQAVLQQLQHQPEARIFTDHLLAFSGIRTEHDDLYELVFEAEQRNAIEGLPPIDLMVVKGERAPALRQRSKTGDFIVAIPEKTNVGVQVVESAYLQRCCKYLTPSVLERLDELIGADSPVPCAAKLMEMAKLPEPGSDDDDALDLKKLAVKLALLAKSLRAKSGDAAETCAALWKRIACRTDQLYVAAEMVQSRVEACVFALAKLVDPSLRGLAIRNGKLKDPIRIHEKSYEYAGEVADGVIPEACVMDVIRCRIVCADSALLIAFQQRLADGFEIAGDVLQLLRVKNKFAHHDPTHFRNVLNNVVLRDSGGRYLAFSEIQVHHKMILEFNDKMDAHSHYNFFRSLFAELYESELDIQLERVLSFIQEVRGVCPSFSASSFSYSPVPAGCGACRRRSTSCTPWRFGPSFNAFCQSTTTRRSGTCCCAPRPQINRWAGVSSARPMPSLRARP